MLKEECCLFRVGATLAKDLDWFIAHIVLAIEGIYLVFCPHISFPLSHISRCTAELGETHAFGLHAVFIILR